MLRKDLKEHLSAYCRFREEKCLYCKRGVVVTSLQVRAHGRLGIHSLPIWTEERIYLAGDVAPLIGCSANIQNVLDLILSMV